MANKHGMFFHRSTATEIKEGVWWEEHCVRRLGGYDVDTDNLPATLRWLPKGTVFKFDASTGKVQVVKSAKVAADAAVGATEIKLEENYLIDVGDTLSGNAVTAVSTADGVTTITVAATKSKYTTGDVLTDYDKSKDTLLGLSYSTNDLLDNEYPQADVTLECVEIEKDSLPYPVNDDIIEGLNKYGKHLFRVL